LGPNGAGKTTSMRVITGYLKSDGGRVLINNKDIDENPIYTKSQIGYLPEGVPLYLDFSPALYLDYVCSVRKVKDAKTQIQKVIQDLQLEDVKDVPIETLSKGFKRRVGIAQSLILDEVPEVCNKCLIIDQGEKRFEGTPTKLKRKIGKSLDEKFRKIIS
ncbi:MAG: ATP-binding cassette domain-containing protein, partial [Bacteriovoracaceae bacterium]